MNVQIAHAIDIDVIQDCATSLERNCEFLVMPRHPHRNSLPGPPLETYLTTIPILDALDRDGRLVWYSAATAPVKGVPVVPVTYFSAEAAVGVLGLLGARIVRSLGIDGGTGYGDDFADLADTTRLANTQPTFDVQFEGIAANAKLFEIDYRALIDPMRIFVGADDSQLVAAAVLEHSIRKFAQGPIEFTVMTDLDIPVPKDPENQPRTGFSFYRFVIPELCGYEGRALYLDADMQVFGDISELWRIPFHGKKVLCTYQTEAPDAWQDNSWFHPGRQMSVMMLDCSSLDWDIKEIVARLDAGRYSYRGLLFQLELLDENEIGDTIPPEWNSLEQYEEGVTKLLHYTVGEIQPWKNDDNLLRHIWEDAYRDAIASGAVDPAVVERGIHKGLYKASLAKSLPHSPIRRLLLRRVHSRARSAVKRFRNRLPGPSRR